MMTWPENVPPQAILLGGIGAPDIATSVRGSMRFRVSFDGVGDVGELIDAVAVELMFPHRASGLDALLDLMSDLDWFGHEEGYVVEFDGLDVLAQRAPALLEKFVALLPNLCDRWRSGGVPFRVVLRCQPTTRRTVREVVEIANAEIEEAARRPWLADLAPAEIVEFTE